MTTRIRRLTVDLEVAENVESHVTDVLPALVEGYLRRMAVEPALNLEDPFAITSLTVRQVGGSGQD